MELLRNTNLSSQGMQEHTERVDNPHMRYGQETRGSRRFNRRENRHYGRGRQGNFPGQDAHPRHPDPDINVEGSERSVGSTNISNQNIGVPHTQEDPQITDPRNQAACNNYNAQPAHGHGKLCIDPLPVIAPINPVQSKMPTKHPLNDSNEQVCALNLSCSKPKIPRKGQNGPGDARTNTQEPHALGEANEQMCALDLRYSGPDSPEEEDDVADSQYFLWKARIPQKPPY